jgi:ATP-binding cassette subfamily B protein
MNIFKCYVCIKQHDIKDCGAACLATISKQYVLKIPISKIREAAGTDKQETRTYGLIKAAEKLGFTAKRVKANKSEDIFNLWQLLLYESILFAEKFIKKIKNSILSDIEKMNSFVLL